MNLSKKTSKSTSRGIALTLIAALLVSGTAIAEKQDPPQTTTDGLTLVKQTKSRLVYQADDIDLQQYSKVMIVDCFVSFAKNWQRDYNRDVMGLDGKVRDSDVKRMKEGMAAEFKKVFTKTMTELGHEVVTEPAADVLILRPAIINIVANAPDVRSASMTRTYVADPGQMTLFLELYDSVSSALLARVIDAQDAARSAPRMSYSNKVTNVAAVDHILKGWATELAEHLGAVKADSASNDDE